MSRPAPAAGRALVAAFLVGLALLMIAIVRGSAPLAPGLAVSYKHLARALVLAWLGVLVLPAGRAALPFRRRPSDLPLALFALAAALSVALGGGHWGDVRNLAAAIGLGWLARTLFAPAARRPRLLDYLGALVVLVLARELAAHPDLLLPREALRYTLVTANPNTLGFLFAMVAPLFLAETTAAMGARRFGAVLYCGAAAAGVLLTFSRTAIAGLAVGGLLVVRTLPHRGRALALAALAALVFVAVQRPDSWQAGRWSGDRDRLRIMATSLTLAAESPFFGIGFGINNLEREFPARYEARYGERLFRFHSMNQLVELLVGTGLVGTALAAWWVACLAAALGARARRAASESDRRRAAGAIAAAAAIAVMSLADVPLYHGKLVLVLFLVLAWAEHEPEASERPR